MPDNRRIRIIAKERSFDAEKWKQLLSAFAYVLHEQRQQSAQPPAAATPPTKEQP